MGRFKRTLIIIALCQYAFLIFRGIVYETFLCVWNAIRSVFTHGPFKAATLLFERSAQTDSVSTFTKTSLYTNWVYGNIVDLWSRIVPSGPGVDIDVVDTRGREYKNVINLGSYNYLGFGGTKNGTCVDNARCTLRKYGVGSTSSPVDMGVSVFTRDLEASLVKFLKRNPESDAVVFPMGHSTNSSGLQAILRKGDYVVSDSLNHNSIRVGCMCISGVVTVNFKHNDMRDLEKKLAEGHAIRNGFPKRIFIIVEGIYSMEGDFCNLPGIIALKKKYKAYLYLDEAHSIGCTGASGRGVCDHFNVDPNEVDILMGTFSKSFGACGGYICSDKETVRSIRAKCGAYIYDSMMSPVCAVQILSVLQMISGTVSTPDARPYDIAHIKMACIANSEKTRMSKLSDGITKLRTGLSSMGFELLGDPKSPVIPMMLYSPAIIAAFSRRCLDMGLAVVVVGFPATPLVEGRARFCVSAEHTDEHLEKILSVVEKVGCECMVDFHKQTLPKTKRDKMG